MFFCIHIQGHSQVHALLSVTVSQENLGKKYSYCFSDQIDKLFSVLQLTIFISVKREADLYSFNSSDSLLDTK